MAPVAQSTVEAEAPASPPQLDRGERLAKLTDKLTVVVLSAETLVEELAEGTERACAARALRAAWEAAALTRELVAPGRPTGAAASADTGRQIH